MCQWNFWQNIIFVTLSIFKPMKRIIEAYFDEKTLLSSPAKQEALNDLELKLKVKLPDDYKEFLRISNGYEGTLGATYVRLSNMNEIIEFTELYCDEDYSWAIYIGTDGGNEIYVLDKRTSEPSFGILPYVGNNADFIFLGQTFEEFIKHIYYNDFWNK